MKERLPYQDAMLVAKRFVELARPCCKRIEIAGSLRREMPSVGDIEIVAIPVMLPTEIPGLLGPMKGPDKSALWALTDRLVAEGKLRADRLLDGNRYRRFVATVGAFEIGIDVFTTSDPDKWGALLAIRTGSADFSRAVMQIGQKRGVTCRELVVSRGGERILTPTEDAFFAAMGLPWIEPRLRGNADAAWRASR